MAPAQLFFVGVGEVSWATTDGGRTYTLVSNKMPLHEVKLHPTDANLILASSMSKKCHSGEATGFCYKNLFASQDFGATWKFLTHYVVQFDWALNLHRDMTQGIAPETVFITSFEKKTGNQVRCWGEGVAQSRLDATTRDGISVALSPR